MKKLLITAGTGLILAAAACNNSSSEINTVDSSGQEALIPAGDQYGKNDPMNNTSDSTGASSTHNATNSTVPQNNGSGRNKQDDERYKPMPSMDTITRNPKNNGDSRRMVIEEIVNH
jgi:hypothetical protein